MEYDDEFEFQSDDSQDYQITEELSTPFNFFSYDNIEFYSEKQVQKDVDDMVSDFVEAFGLSQGLALSLLIKNKMDKEKAEVSLQDDPTVIPQLKKINSFYVKNQDCLICLDELNEGNTVFPSNCEHKCCKNCLACYLETETVSNKLLPFKCIQEGCPEFISLSTVQKFLAPKHMPRLCKNLINSIVLSSDKLKFCPGPNCTLIIKFNDFINSKKAINIRCRCNMCFCSHCNREAHLPLSCELYVEWDSLHSKGSDMYTESWIQLKTKKCPTCQTPIEKNKGCMHMTCRNCVHEFCWLCMKDWSKHGSETGGYYKCNMYNPNDDDAKKKNKLANDLERFKFLSERYLEHKNSVIHSEKKKENMMKEYLEIIKELHQPNEEYLLNALNLIIDCRRAIAYSYGVAHFLKDPAKLTFFQFLQNQAESFLEILDNETDKDLKDFIVKEASNCFSEAYFTWSNNIKIKTQTLKSYFNQILHELENGLPSVVQGLPFHKQDSLYEYKEEQTHWICPVCTLANELSRATCDACDGPRPNNL